jgi:glycerol-3-phosphate dehydrogenase subunit C
MREGGLEAPMRHALPWRERAFADAGRLDAEMRRVFDICHGCRRCFNLCDSFPRLFDLVDSSSTGEVDGVSSADFRKVVDACTLCDMCFMTKCPYVPPHEFDLDFPHLMLRARAARADAARPGFFRRQILETDRNGRLARRFAALANWAIRRGNRLTRPLIELLAGVHRDAELPPFAARTLEEAAADAPAPDPAAPAFGRKAVLYATCFANYNVPAIGLAALKVLAKNGVEARVAYPSCCGMPQLEQGRLDRVAEVAACVSAALATWVDQGYDVIALVPSCALMLKFEWPLILPEDTAVKRLAGATFDVAEYVVDIARKEGLAPGLKPLAGGVALHVACHARAQNVGAKAAELLRLLPETPLSVIERCSGHGGTFGAMKENFETALKTGRPVARQALEAAMPYVVSECPLARRHVVQGMERLEGKHVAVGAFHHPIELVARAYGM